MLVKSCKVPNTFEPVKIEITLDTFTEFDNFKTWMTAVSTGGDSYSKTNLTLAHELATVLNRY